MRQRGGVGVPQKVTFAKCCNTKGEGRGHQKVKNNDKTWEEGGRGNYNCILIVLYKTGKINNLSLLLWKVHKKSFLKVNRRFTFWKVEGQTFWVFKFLRGLELGYDYFAQENIKRRKKIKIINWVKKKGNNYITRGLLEFYNICVHINSITAFMQRWQRLFFNIFVQLGDSIKSLRV